MCGIFGLINKHKQGKFNYPAFVTMGTANDTRGGDSCGIFIDKVVRIGVDKEKLFRKFILNPEVDSWLSNLQQAHIALGHCRKASIGAIDAMRAQPVVISENNDVKFVLIHNGTLYNYAELAAKYLPDFNIAGMSDSQVLARILYNNHWEVLSEYIGGAAFCAVDYRCKFPKTYLFKGASKLTEYTETAIEERPLYYSLTDAGLIFSSIFEYLVPFAKDDDIYSLKSNSIITYYKGNLVVEKEIDRSKCSQTKPVVVSNTYYPAYTSAGYSTWGKSTYSPYSSYSGLSSNQVPKGEKKEVVEKEYPELPFEDTASKNVLQVTPTVEGMYYNNNKPIHGKQLLTMEGKASSSGYPFYFWHGYLLKNEKCFTFLKSFAAKSGYKEKELDDVYPDLIQYLSMFPTCTEINNDLFYSTLSDDGNLVPYTGTIQYLGDDYFFTTNYGVLDEFNKAATTCIVERFYNMGQEFDISMDTVNKLV